MDAPREFRRAKCGGMDATIRAARAYLGAVSQEDLQRTEGHAPPGPPPNSFRLDGGTVPASGPQSGACFPRRVFPERDFAGRSPKEVGLPPPYPRLVSFRLAGGTVPASGPQSGARHFGRAGCSPLQSGHTFSFLLPPSSFFSQWGALGRKPTARARCALDYGVFPPGSLWAVCV